MSVRVVLVGCGRIAGYFHGPILGNMPGAELVAAVDADPDARARATARTPGVTRFADWAPALATMPLDAAVICLPPALHAPAARDALAAGLHVYIEKPLATTLADGQAICSAAEAAGRVAAAGFNFRFHPLIEDARTRIARGELGEIIAVRSLFTAARRVLPGWKRERGLGGGVLADLGSHHFDVIPFLTGAPFVEGSLAASLSTAEDGEAASVLGQLEGGTQVSMTVSQLTGHGTNRLEILGEKGHLTVDLSAARPAALERPPGRLARVHRMTARLRALTPAELLHNPGAEPSFGRALAAFVAAATGAQTDLATARDGLAVMRLVEEAEHAAETPAAPLELEKAG